VTTSGESTESIFPILVDVNDVYIDVSYIENYLPLSTVVEGNECFLLNGSPPVEAVSVLWHYDPWFHGGAFSAKDYARFQSEIDHQAAPLLDLAAVGCAFYCQPAEPYVLAVWASAVVGGMVYGELAEDPPDPNYTEIAVPVTPTTSLQPVMPGNGLTQVQADAFNALLTNGGQSIGLGRAILTSFNRASGAQQANDSYWVEQQLQAARVYAGQLADLLEARPQVLENMKQALLTFQGLPFDITSEEMASYKYDLLTQGFSADQQQLLTELGLDAHGQGEVLNALLLSEFPQGVLPQDPIAQFPSLLTDPDLIASTQALAGALREFSEGQGWKLFMPTVMR
jgi:hypothetical protein